MIRMAGSAALRLDPDRAVESPIPFRKPAHILVAGETAGRHRVRGAASVALGAFEGAFEILVGPGERTGRDLGRCGADPSAGEQENPEREVPDHQNQVMPIDTTTPT